MLDFNSASRLDQFEVMATDEAQGVTSAKPNRVPFRDVPAFLRDINEQRFCVWKWLQNTQGKWTKPPHGTAGYKIASDKPNAWVSLDQALTAFKNGQGFDGIGLMLKDLKGYAFLDLDDCRDPDTGGAVSWAQQMIDQASSYTELTPSGTGFRIIGTVPEDFRHMHTTVQRGAGHVEIYANSTTGRYATITGAKLDGSPDALADLSALIDDLQPLPSKEEGAFDFNAAPRQFSRDDGCEGYRRVWSDRLRVQQCRSDCRSRAAARIDSRRLGLADRH